MMIKAVNAQKLGFAALFACIIIALLVLGSLIYFIFSNGISSFSWTFFTDIPRKSMTAGGVGPAIIGTIYLVLGSIIVSVPHGSESGDESPHSTNSPDWAERWPRPK